jgi:hypothetical protein
MARLETGASVQRLVWLVTLYFGAVSRLRRSSSASRSFG